MLSPILLHSDRTELEELALAKAETLFRVAFDIPNCFMMALWRT
jgi:hypothetical protein